MYIPLGIKTDYSLYKSIIKIPSLISYLKEHNIDTCGILDDNLFGCIEFYNSCQKNNIKPIVGLKINILDKYLYLYAKNYNGYQNLLKINTYINKEELSLINLKSYKKDIICILPVQNKDIYDSINEIFPNLYISYRDDFEKKNACIITKNIVYLPEIRAYKFQDIKYLQLLEQIETGEIHDLQEYNNTYIENDVTEEDKNTTIEFAKMIDFQIDKTINYIPHYDTNIEDSFIYLKTLCIKGLNKRLNNEIPKEYADRLMMELNVINKMGFVDYILIVYDYVKFAKNNNILVGPGRGSAAGSLVCYSIGITNIDPLKFNLLFERFLNPERVTMPDIDIDFEDGEKREQVVNYIKNKYGEEKVATIISFGTFGSRQILHDVGKIFQIDEKIIKNLIDILNPKQNLKENLNNKQVHEFIMHNSELERLYKISYKLEGIKRYIGKHAAGVVISSKNIDDIIPIYYNNGELQTGITKDYLEDLGLIKMDILAVTNITLIQNTLELIEKETGTKIDLSKIPDNDEKTMNIFKSVDTNGIFQFESSGMKNLTAKLKPDTFSDLIAEVALFRPGPMDNIDLFIKRKNSKEKITYPDPSLEEILKDTYGIMIYQEQIMQVLVKMANYTFAEADNIRRAMSKKKIDIMNSERETFINRSIKNGYTKEKANEIYDLIVKFAGYGFNKAHSVAYALVAYQMAYLKAHYPIYFIVNLLTMNINSEEKTKEYIDEAKRNNIIVVKPNINVSTQEYKIKNNALLLPLKSIKGLGITICNDIIEEREKNGPYKDFFNFVSRTYGRSVNKEIIEKLIDADCFREYKINHKTLHNTLESALDYAMLCKDLDESLVMKPDYIIEEEYTEIELMNKDLNTFGFFVTNHPASKYQDGIMKLKDIKKYFDKYVTCAVIINSIRKIKTKKGEDMAFINASDETDSNDFIIFPKNNKFLTNIKKNQLVKIKGQVTRRMDKFQIVINNIEIL